MIEFSREDDGRWIAVIPSCPGAMAYGDSPKDAALNAITGLLWVAIHDDEPKYKNLDYLRSVIQEAVNLEL